MSQSGSASRETDANSKPARLSDKLQSALEVTLEKFTSNLKYSAFREKFGPIHEADPDGLKSLHDQLITQFRKNVREDLKSCSASYGVASSLKSLERINESKNAITWRPSGNPEEDVRDHIYAEKLKLKDSLENYLTTLQDENEVITTEVAVNHSKILHLNEGYKKLNEKFSNIVDLYTGRNFQNFETKAEECLKEIEK